MKTAITSASSSLSTTTTAKTEATAETNNGASSAADIIKNPLITTGDDIVADDSLLDEFRSKLLELKQEPKSTDDAEREDDANAQGGAVLYDNTEIDNMIKDDNNLRRLLIARCNNLEKSLTMAKGIIQWRTKIQPHKLTVQDFPIAHAQGVYRFAGYAKNGWGIIKVIARNWSSYAYSVDEYCKMVAYYMEHNLARCRNNANGDTAKNFLIFDMKHMSYMSDFRKLRVLAKLTNDYYPERLGIAVIVNCDYVFDMIFNIMVRWVDKRTSNKAIDFRTNGSEFLREHVDLDQLTTDLGGTRDEEWPLEDL